jgi:ABC-2 type transport system ATP-binding protein
MIEIKDVNFGYKKRGLLFDGLNLQLKPGNIYGLLGKNGAGKTTLLKIISGLLHISKGELLLDGAKIIERDPAILQDIYFLPENCYLPDMQMDEYFEIYSVFYNRFNKTKFDEYLVKFEIPFAVKLSSLSFGQKKKFAIAFALAAESRILLLDEPTNGLDIPSKSIFRKLLAESINEEKVFLLSTHQARDVKNLIDSIIILEAGGVIFNQSLADTGDKLSLCFLQKEPNANDILYCEKTLGGYAVFAEKEKYSNDENEIDIEMLFNAVLEQKEKFAAFFSKGVDNEKTL